jgi:hypothetical protein
VPGEGGHAAQAGVMPLKQAMNNRDSGGPRRSQKTVAIAEYAATARRAHMSTPPHSSSSDRTRRIESAVRSKMTAVTANDAKRCSERSLETRTTNA